MAFLQAPELKVDDHVAAFLKDDPAARSELLKLGAAAIRPLQKAREKGPAKIDPLVLELKKGVMVPFDSKLARDLEAKVTLREATIELHDESDRRKLDWNDARRVFPCPLVVLPFDRADVKSMSATVKVADRPIREILELFAAQTGLDFGYFHNAVVIGPPDKLWAPLRFRPAAAASQKLDPGDAVLLKMLQSRAGSATRLVDPTLEAIADYLLKPRDIEYAFAAPAAKAFVIPVIDADEISPFDLLSLATQAAGYDFSIAGARVVIDALQGK